MEILIRLFIWIMNRTYGRHNVPSGYGYGSNPMDEKVLIELDEARKLEREAKRQDAVVQSFKTTAESVHGAVDYAELEWNLYDRAVETPEQFVFYNGRSMQ